MEKKLYDLKIDPELRDLMMKLYNKGGGKGTLKPYSLYEHQG